MGFRRAQPSRKSTPAPHGDEALVQLARCGDHAAFEQLACRHTDQIYRIVRRLGLSADDAEDVTQETFLRAWRGVANFKGDAQFSTWLVRIAVNEANRHLKRNASATRISSLDADGVPDPPDLRAEPYLRLVETRRNAALASSIRALPIKYRIPLVLRDVEGLTTAEAARVSGLSETAFKSRLHRARMAVRGALEHEPDSAP